jgi:hypothetical protein
MSTINSPLFYIDMKRVSVMDIFENKVLTEIVDPSGNVEDASHDIP